MSTLRWPRSASPQVASRNRVAAGSSRLPPGSTVRRLRGSACAGGVVSVGRKLKGKLKSSLSRKAAFTSTPHFSCGPGGAASSGEPAGSASCAVAAEASESAESEARKASNTQREELAGRTNTLLVTTLRSRDRGG